MSIKAGTKQKKAFYFISAAAAAILYLWDVFYISRNGEALLNSDGAAELILADQLNQEHAIVSRNWFYSTELRVLSMQLIYKPALWLFPDHWQAARTFAVALFLLLLMVCSVFFMKTIGEGRLSFVFAFIVISPYSCWYGWNVVFNSHYVFHIAITLTAISLFLITIGPIGNGKRVLRYVAGAASLLLAFVSCLDGVRRMMVCYAPLWLAVVLYLYVSRSSGSGKTRKEQYKMFLWATLITAAGAAGLFVNSRVLSRIYHFQDQGAMQWEPFQLEKLWNCLGDLIGLYGWHEGVNIISAGGVGCLLSLCLVTVLVLCTLWNFRRWKDLSLREQAVLLFSVVSFLLLLCVYSFTSVYNASYWTVWLPFGFVGLLIWLSHNQDLVSRLCGILLAAAAIILNSITTFQNPYISWVQNDKAIMPVADWLEKNGYTQGIALFWDSDIVTALTDGKIEMWTVLDNNTMEIYDWLQTTDHAEHLPEGETFLIRYASDRESEDEETQRIIAAIEPELVYEDEHYLVYSFDDVNEYISVLHDEH